MGQCYYVEAHLLFKNDDPKLFCKIIEHEVTARDGVSAHFNINHDDSFNTPFECFKILTKDAQFDLKKNIMYAGFNASYGSESVMYEIFKASMEALKEGSFVSVWPDHGMWKIYISDGEIKELDEEEDEEEEDAL